MMKIPESFFLNISAFYDNQECFSHVLYNMNIKF